MDHVSPNSDCRTEAESHVKITSNSLYQVYPDDSESEKLFIEESQAVNSNFQCNGTNYEPTASSNNSLGNIELPNRTENAATVGTIQDSDVDDQAISHPNILKNATFGKCGESCDTANNDVSDNTDSTDLCPATSTDTFTSSSSVTSVLSAASALVNVSPKSDNHVSSSETKCSHPDLEANNKKKITETETMNSNDANESLSRKRKMINTMPMEMNTKIKRLPDDYNVENSSVVTRSLSGLDFPDTDSFNTSTDTEIPDFSLEQDLSNSVCINKTISNGISKKDDACLDSSENNHLSACPSLSKDDLDLMNCSENNDIQNKCDFIFLNTPEGLSHEVPSPDQIPTFELSSKLDEHNDIVSLAVVRTDRKYLDYNADWSQNSSPGSVTSTGVFQISDQKRFSTISTSTTSSGYSLRTTDNFAIPAIPSKKSNIHKQGIKGHKELFRLVKEIFRLALTGLASDSEDINLFHEKLYNDDKIPESFNKNPEVTTNVVKGEKNDETLDNQYEVINSPEMITDENTSTCATSRPMTPRTKQIRKAVRTRPASPRLKSVLQEDALKQDHRISYRVLARWIDRKYYAGRIAQVKDLNKYVIKFDDDHTKTLIDEYIIFGDHEILPLQGQSVLVLLNADQDYEPGLVTSFIADGDDVSYTVETDAGITTTVSASDFCLTEDQARAIKDIQVAESDQSTTPRRGSNRDLSLDNIIQGPRSRRQTLKCLTPKAGSSGLGKKRHIGKSKPRHVSESSDRSVTEPTSPSSTTENEENVTKAPIEEVQGVDPEVQKTPKKIPGALTGPFPVKGCGRLSGRRTSKVVGSMYDNSDPETVDVLGPIPDSSILFINKHFLLTCTEDRNNLGRLSSYETNSGTDSEYSTDTESHSTPFVKERLKCQLEAGGGTVYSHFEDIPQSKYRHCILVAPRACHTAKYIQCLATNIKAVKHNWVIDCCKSNKLLLLSGYDLPAGYSIERKCYVRYEIGKELYMRLSSNPFNDFLILLCSDNANFIQFWGRVCKSAGASTKTIDDDVDISVGSVVVTDSDCPLKVRKQAQSLEIPLVSTTWVVQSLIIGQVCNYDNNIRYAHNYVDTD